MTYSQEEAQRPVSGGFTRAELEALPDDVAREVLLGRVTKTEYDRRQEAERTREAEAAYSTADRPAPAPSQADGDPYQITSWGQNEYDFVVPSGQRCRLRNLNERMLLEAGILDQVTRLPGVVLDGPVRQAQGKPPVAQEATIQDMLKDKDKFIDFMDVLNTLVALVVVAPPLLPVPPENEDRQPGRIYADSVNLGDRVAIMERVMGGVSKLDAFR